MTLSTKTVRELTEWLNSLSPSEYLKVSSLSFTPTQEIIEAREKIEKLLPPKPSYALNSQSYQMGFLDAIEMILEIIKTDEEAKKE